MVSKYWHGTNAALPPNTHLATMSARPWLRRDVDAHGRAASIAAQRQKVAHLRIVEVRDPALPCNGGDRGHPLPDAR